MKNSYRSFLIIVAFFVALAGSGFAQGVTTSSLTGLVTDGKGEPLVGAKIIATHVPSGSKYGAISKTDGRYNIPGMRVGGPYEVVVKFEGTRTATFNNVFLSLGIAGNIDAKLSEMETTTEEVLVVADRYSAISSDRTGAVTNINRETITSLPTLNRNFTDFTRLTPQANGVSFGGQDNRLNNITVDGSFFNNSFGLAGVPGGRAGTSPLTLEALEEISVAIAPYDVRQAGFVGAGVNLVTRSGTNTIKGTVFGNFRNQSFLGRDAADRTLTVNDQQNVQAGFSIGGPIIKDKLFLFVAAETEQNQTPFVFRPRVDETESFGGNISRPTVAQMTRFSNFLRDSLGYETGPFQGYNQSRPESYNWIAKVNWNIDDNNKFSFRYNALSASQDVPISNSASLGFGNRQNQNALSYQNSNYIQNDRIQSFIAELNSTIGTNFYNQLQFGYTYQNEDRGSRGDFFPLIEIQQAGSTLLSAGFEPFTPSNQLSYGTYQFQNNLTIFAGSHTITAGIQVLHYRFRNLFFPGSQSVYVYNSEEDFYSDARDFINNPNRTTSPVSLLRFQYRYSALPGFADPVQPTNAWYPGIYIQDEWQVSKNFRLSGGLRVDVPIFESTGFRNPRVETVSFVDAQGNPSRSRTDILPSAQALISPRVGFNWDVFEDRTLQIRGGTGVFTGQPAFVWISNQIGNNGVLTGFIDESNTTARPFNSNPFAYRPATATLPSTFELATTDPNFSFPQVWRTSLGADYQLPYDFVATLDLIYSRAVNGISYINSNLRPSSRIFNGPDNRLRFDGNSGNANRINPFISSNIVLGNSGLDDAFVLTLQLQKVFSDNWFATVAYTHTSARNTVDPGSIAFGTWSNNPVAFNPNGLELGVTRNALPHRFVGSVGYRLSYGDIGSTQITLFAEANPQGNFSYIYNGDMNGDGQSANDLLFVPVRAADLRFLSLTIGSGASAVTFTPEQQAAAFEAYIEQDRYLRTRRGQYAERNAAVFPWLFRANLTVTQDFYINFGDARNTLQFRADVFNLANLLNKNWGVGWQTNANFNNPANGAQILNSAGPAADGTPQYRMPTITVDGQPRLITESFRNSATLNDVWSAQFGIRYFFN